MARHRMMSSLPLFFGGNTNSHNKGNAGSDSHESHQHNGRKKSALHYLSHLSHSIREMVCSRPSPTPTFSLDTETRCGSFYIYFGVFLLCIGLSAFVGIGVTNHLNGGGSLPLMSLLSKKGSKSSGPLVEWFSSEEGFLDLPDRLPEFSNGQVPSTISFVKEHLGLSIPAILRGFSATWPAYELWRDDEYLKSKVGSENVRVEQSKNGDFAYFAKDFSELRIPFSEFLDMYNSPTRDRNYYLSECTLFDALKSDLFEPEFVEVLKHEVTNLWIGAGNFQSLPHTDDMENILCQLSGVKSLVIVDPTQRKALKPLKEPSNYSPIDFFNPDFEKYPEFKDVISFQVDLHAGDCLFLPAFWWHHVKSSGRNLAINFWYRTHNSLIRSAMGCIESADC